VDFKLQLVASEQEVDVYTNCSLLTVISRFKNCTKLIASVIDDRPRVEQRMKAIAHVIEQMEEAKTRLVNQYEIFADVATLLEEQASDNDKQLELDLGE
tara:strand:+ start:1710 stop:2006 length:297 start_codon:yes stop_codon:yes gene_type:complete